MLQRAGGAVDVEHLPAGTGEQNPLERSPTMHWSIYCTNVYHVNTWFQRNEAEDGVSSLEPRHFPLHPVDWFL